MNVQQRETELWAAADQLRTNSKRTAAEYAMPMLGLIFLRHADNRFKPWAAARSTGGSSTTRHAQEPAQGAACVRAGRSGRHH